MRFARATASDLLGRTTTALRLPGMQTAQLPPSVGRTTRFCSGIVALRMKTRVPVRGKSMHRPFPAQPGRFGDYRERAWGMIEDPRVLATALPHDRSHPE